ncbi:hypothetical protein AB0K40_23290 [Nonomuraea bangladeshensis]|uniref:DUF4259 domain-containing protein n=1 Tax=Nonomuraea bangladeshensis TaxID=404385 RepID=A0ABV3H7W5_9ACTN
MDLPAGLRERLADLRGDLLWGRLSGNVADAGWLACDLIEAGLDTPTVWELAGYALSIGPMQEIEPLVRQVLAETGFPAIDLRREPWAVTQDVAHGIAEGTLPIGTGADFLLELGERWATPEEIWDLIVLIDDGESLRGTPPTDDELREQARKIADAAPGWPDAKADQEP